MTARTHLFVAAQKAPFGEAVLGMRIARDLAARGDRVLFAAPDSLAVIVEKTAIVHVRLGDDKRAIDRLLVDLAKRERADGVVLLDIASTYMLLKALRLDAAFARAFTIPLLGLDVWDLRRAGLTWDMCGATWDHSAHTRDVDRRLVPVPFARPDADPGLYNALPPAAADVAGNDDRAALREDLGLGLRDKLVLLTSAYWQQPALQPHPNGKRLSMTFPLLLCELLGRLDPRVHIVHVGPEPMAPMALALAERYHWLPQRNPERFARVLRAADLLAAFNFSATTIISAIAAGLPVVLGINSRGGGTVDEVVGGLAHRPSAGVLRWLEGAVPLCPFRVWPLGLHRFLEPIAADNPYTAAFRTVEILEEEAYVETIHRMLFDRTEADELRAAQAAYREVVRTLPSGADVVLAHLDGA